VTLVHKGVQTSKKVTCLPKPNHFDMVNSQYHPLMIGDFYYFFLKFGFSSVNGACFQHSPHEVGVK
jgi:hypothetical protein